MTINEYQQLAKRTINRELTKSELTNHALFGLASEVGEIHGLFQKTFQGHDLDIHHVFSEMGDCMWFMAELATSIGFKLEDICEYNIEKLKKRYPSGFDADKSLHRAEGDI